MIMQTIKIIGRRKTKPSSLVRQTSKTLVDKRHIMQSSAAIRAEYRVVSNSNKFKKLNWKQSEKYFKKICKVHTIRSCVRIDWFKWWYRKIQHFRKQTGHATAGQATWWCNEVKRNQLSIYNRS